MSAAERTKLSDGLRVATSGLSDALRNFLEAHNDLVEATHLVSLVAGECCSLTGVANVDIQARCRGLRSDLGRPDDDAVAPALGFDEIDCIQQDGEELTALIEFLVRRSERPALSTV